jgi:sRNA-binding regulator protein Hfq
MNKPTLPEQIINESLWVNDFVTYKQGGKEYNLFLKNWISAGIKTIGDVWDFTTKNWKTKNDLSVSILLLTDMQYKRVVSSIDKYKNILINAKNEQMNYLPKIKTNTGVLYLEKITSKKLYNIMIQDCKDGMPHEKKLQELFNEPLEWKIYTYLLPL